MDRETGIRDEHGLVGASRAPAPLHGEIQASLPGDCCFLPGKNRALQCPCRHTGLQPWMISIVPQGNNLQTTCPGTWALKDSPEPRHGGSDSERCRRWHIPGSLWLVAVASVPPPSPGAQGDVFAEGEPDNRGKWAVPCTPMAVAHGPSRCCPRQAEASGLSQPRPHVAGTLLFVLVPRDRGNLASLGTRDRNCRHLTAQPRAWGQQGLALLVTSTRTGPYQTGVLERHGMGTRAAQGRRPERGEATASLAAAPRHSLNPSQGQG